MQTERNPSKEVDTENSPEDPDQLAHRSHALHTLLMPSTHVWRMAYMSFCFFLKLRNSRFPRQPSAPREVSPEDLPEIYQLEELLCATMLGFVESANRCLGGHPRCFCTAEKQMGIEACFKACRTGLVNVQVLVLTSWICAK